MPEELTAEQAAVRLATDDTLGMPLGPGQPPAFMRALGEREDWTDLRVYGALLAVGTELFSRTGVAYLSGFFGPIERALRDAGANIGFAPADFRRFGPLLERQRPRVMTTVATPPDADGWCSLSLHAGGTIGELRRAGADPDRLLVVEVSDAYPRTFGLGKHHRHALHVDEIDVLVQSTDAPLALPGGEAPATDVDKAIARHAVNFVPSGATLQTGIGSIPSQIATLLAEGDGGDYGLHSEMFTDGCMQLHRAGKVTNAGKGQYDGVSVQSRIVPWFGPGAVITTPRHQVDVIVTEYGAAELEGKTVQERGEALAAIAHPQFRDELLAAAERASKGRSPVA